jgi:hypothetical protein
MQRAEDSRPPGGDWIAKLKDDLQATLKFWIGRRRKKGRAITTVKDDLQSTVNDRALFQAFTELVAENEKWIAEHEGLFFCQFVLRAYVARVALGMSLRAPHLGWALRMATRSTMTSGLTPSGLVRGRRDKSRKASTPPLL